MLFLKFSSIGTTLPRVFGKLSPAPPEEYGLVPLPSHRVSILIV